MKNKLLYNNVMKSVFLTVITLFFFFFDSCTFTAKKGKWVAEAPADTLLTKINVNGKTVIPNGRFITPYGKSFVVAPHPFGLTLSEDGKIAVTANSGVRPLSISILRKIDSGHPDILQIPPDISTIVLEVSLKLSGISLECLI